MLRTKCFLAVFFVIAMGLNSIAQVRMQNIILPGINIKSLSLPNPEIKKLRLFKDVNDVSDECNLYTYSGLAFENFKIIGVSDSTFAITNDSLLKDVQIRDLRKLVFIKHGFWKGFLWGSLGTLGLAGIGIFAVLASKPHGDEGFAIPVLFYAGLILAVPVGALSGLITDFFTSDEKYYFDRNNNSLTPGRLKYLVHMHKK